MPITAAQLVAKVEVTGDTEAKAKLQGVSEKVKETGGGFKSMLSNALSFAGGQAIFMGLGILKDQIGSIFEESMNAQAGLAQTNQVLKSTHGQAGVTAQAVLDLATQYSHLTQFSDDTVQASENMLLTFTNIGKNVFPTATKTVLDMSQALGQDTKNSAIQLGKALNDPLTGITALQRVGVTFSQGQKDQIKGFMDTNNIAGAQKVILKELQKEFGGSAEAAGKTFPGQLKILGQNFDDLKQNIGDAVIPVLSRLVGWVTSTVIPALGRFGDWFAKNGLPVLQQFGGWIQANVLPILQRFGQWFVTTAVPALQQFGNMLKTQVFPVLQNLVQIVGIVLTWIKDHWTLIWGMLGPILKGAWDLITNVIKTAWAIVSGIIKVALDLLRGDWGKAWTDLKNMLGGIWDGIKGIVKAAWDIVTGILSGAWKGIQAIWGGISSWFNDHVIGPIKALWQGLVDWFRGNPANATTVHTDVTGGTYTGGYGAPYAHAHALGTSFAPGGLSLLGENEPELVVGRQLGFVPRGAGIYPLSQMGGGQQIQVIVNPPPIYLDGRRLTQAQMPYIANAIRYARGTYGL